MNPKITPYLTEAQIQNRIVQLGGQITKDYQGQEVLMLGILTGAFVFCADLIRQIKIPLLVDFISASSYGNATTSSGQVNFNLHFKHPITHKHVIIVEDIIDTGLTLTKLIATLQAMGPASIKLAALLAKPANHTAFPHAVDYLGFAIENKFVIGYGLDYAGKYRELPFIGIYGEDKDK